MTINNGIGILMDISKCIGCGACAIACKEANGLPGGVSEELDAYTWTVVEQRNGLFIRRQCMHCLEPTCVSVCPVGALQKTRWGAVVYDAKKCIGCRYCVLACPFDIPKYQWDTPSPLVGKCILCAETRLKDGKEPACTEVCPTGAAVFGDRKKLLQEAKRRIAEHPAVYINSIYGEQEAGGTSVMYISPRPFNELGLKAKLRPESYPKLNRQLMDNVPPAAGVIGAAAFGVMWVINRRIEMKHRALENEEDKE